MEKPLICVVNTGGTIASQYNVELGGWESSASAEDMIAFAPGVDEIASIQMIEHAQVNGYRIDTETVVAMSLRVRELVEDPKVAGCVIVHGTATLEETAYLLDLTISSPKPIVVTGAQRRFDDPSSDGPMNLANAIRTAADPQSPGRGVIVALGGELHAARDSIKAHTQRLGVFTSRDGGPIGFVSNYGVTYFASPERRMHFDVDEVKQNVQLIKMAQGMNDLLLRACIRERVDGIVIEGFGGGHVNDPSFAAVEDAVNENIPVIICTRVLAGTTHGEYVHPGSHRRLRELGVIPGGFLSGQKARILLMVALGKFSDRKSLKQVFERA